MAHFAKLDENNVVINVEHVNDQDCLKDGVEDEATGIAHQAAITGYSKWKKYSYNTLNNKHLLGGTPFRGNMATIGGTYDEINDMFFPPRIHPSWVKDVANAKWIAPVAEPTSDDPEKGIVWDETNIRWVRTNIATGTFVDYWNPNNSTWNPIT